jgi:hypothetical protein
MDGPYLPKGADQIILEENESDSNNEKDTPQPYVVSKDGLIILDCLDSRATIYCFFDFSIRPIKYTMSQEFTNLWRRARKVLAYAYGPLGVSKTVKLKVSNNHLYIYYNTNLISMHKIQNKKFNYIESDYIGALSTKLNQKKCDIQTTAKNNLELLDKISKCGK